MVLLPESGLTMNSFDQSDPNKARDELPSYSAGNSGQPESPGPGQEWNPYEPYSTESYAANYQTQTVSALSILSMISGLLSVPLICLCFLSIPFSLFAIVSGHISRGICRRTQGRISGDGMAVAGLILGYSSFLITAGMLVFSGIVLNIQPAAAPAPAMAPTAMNAAESTEELDQAIAMLTHFETSGRTPEATELAQHLQAALHDLARQLAVEGTSTVPGSDAVVEPQSVPPDIVAELPEQSRSGPLQQGLSECRVYCELHKDSCAFLIRVSNLPELGLANQTQLAKLIWLAAGQTVDGIRDEGCKLSIGFVSDGQLAEISMGHFERSDQFDAGLQYREPADNHEIRLAFAKLFNAPLPG